jgi:hypothetical protein
MSVHLKKMPVPGVGTSRDPVGIFQDYIVPKKGPQEQEISSFSMNFNSFYINVLNGHFEPRRGPDREAI